MFRNRFPFLEEAGSSEGAGGASSVSSEGGGSTAQSDPPSEGVTPSPAPASPPPPSDWRSLLPREVADSPTLKDVPDLQTLVKNYEHTKAMVGSSVRIPTEEAGAEDIAAIQQKLLEREYLGLMKKPDVENPDSLAEVYRALGRPEDVSGYSVPEEVNGELFGSMAETALELGLSNRQYEGLAKKFADQQTVEFQQYEEQRTQEVGQLRGEWGPAFDQKVGRAVKIAEALKAPQALVDALKNGSANAEAMRFMDTVATQLGAEGSQLANQIGQVTESTVSDIKDRISDRTKRMLNEKMTRQEYDDLMQRNVKDHELLASQRK